MVSLDLLIAAPSDPATLNSWGDVHFARALQRGFQRLGVTTRLLFRDTYQTALPPAEDAVLLVLRGKMKPDLHWLVQSGYRHRLVWLISWPDDPSPSELACYDLGFSASHQDLERLRGLSRYAWHALPQATEFLLQGPPRPVRTGLLFVGNCRGGPRPMVELFDRAGLNLCLFGAGWTGAGYLSRGDQIANGALPGLYRRSLAVLNDHHPAMARLGYLSNRVFDVLACGVPVISDSIAGCPGELQDLVVIHTPDQDPLDTLAKVTHLRSDVDRLRDRALDVHRHHSFRCRAEEILNWMSKL
ncbi:MAG: glycosyltransferase [Cyanobacteriota bacterium]|nr:glycosyltransferase [Cyanobacteriota bacterium]